MKSINLKQCLKIIAMAKARGREDEYRIGILSDAAPAHMGHYKNEPFLFHKCHYGDDLVIEKPMDDDWLERQKLNDSYLTTYCTMVGVPASLVIEIII